MNKLLGVTTAVLLAVANVAILTFAPAEKAHAFSPGSLQQCLDRRGTTLYSETLVTDGTKQYVAPGKSYLSFQGIIKVNADDPGQNVDIIVSDVDNNPDYAIQLIGTDKQYFRKTNADSVSSFATIINNEYGGTNVGSNDPSWFLDTKVSKIGTTNYAVGISCINFVQCVPYPSGYTGVVFNNYNQWRNTANPDYDCTVPNSDYTPEELAAAQAQNSDDNEDSGGIFGGVISWLKKVYNSIVNGFQELATGIRLLFIEMFIPSGTVIPDKITELRDNTANQFGFLYYPFEVISNLNQRFNQAEDLCAAGATSQECRGYVNFGSLSFGGQQSDNDNVVLNLPEFEDKLPALYVGLKILIISLVVFGLIFAMQHKYMDIVKR